ncbi:sodium:solute symporter [Streptantibioticus rubrisoli]|uniref:Sodium:solute symporter n=1 Tax=Streptantibioticus rubrisoli TaxID=1387313 RepID=A0ABT1P7X9_9ACTN|nr:sodium:solute symporter [Streptantibioticus rubrisoli]MCQ4041468.1 sodium:solute symporter [Streptantibioticus rubrisoli]
MLVVSFALPVAVACAVAVFAAWYPRDAGGLPSSSSWALADRSLGPSATCLLLTGVVYTAYTYLAIPGLASTEGGMACYAIDYTALLGPLALTILPRLRSLAARHSLVTSADLVRARYGSPLLATAAAATGLLASMPYLALQMVGSRALLAAAGLGRRGAAEILFLGALCLLSSIGSHRAGLRALAKVAPVKVVFVGVALLLIVVLVATREHGAARLFQGAAVQLAGHGGSLVPSPRHASAYATLALGSALALPMYPQVFTVVLAARDSRALRVTSVFLPLWALWLGLFAMVGLAAVAEGIHVTRLNDVMAVPLLIRRLAPDWLAGLIFGSLAVGALLPAAAMAIGMSQLFVRNVYTEFINPAATPKHEVKVARWTALALKVGAVAFALLVRPQAAVDMHLLGGVWILQTFPMVIASLFTAWFHPVALLAGWAAGMGVGTVASDLHGFHSIIVLHIWTIRLPLYTALLGFIVNVGIALSLTPILRWAGVPRGADAIAGGAVVPRRERFRFMRVT